MGTGIQQSLERCDREIERCLEASLISDHPGGPLLGLRDWSMERRFIMEEFVQAALRTEPSKEQYADALARLGDIRTLRLLHVAMGLCTEAGEFLETLKKHIFYGKPIDNGNLKEELGDGSWYQRIGCDVLEMKLVELLESNVAKLKARYPDKFTEDYALNRDLEAERYALGVTDAKESVCEGRCPTRIIVGTGYIYCAYKQGHSGKHSFASVGGESVGGVMSTGQNAKYCFVQSPGGTSGENRKCCVYEYGHDGPHSWETPSVEFKSGAASSKVPRLDLIPYEALCRLAERFELGLERHKEKSWNARQNQQALEDKEWVIARAVHTIHHALKYIEKLEGRLPDDGDDDAAAIMWAGACLIMAKKANAKTPQ